MSIEGGQIEKRRPTGVTLIAGLNLIIGVLVMTAAAGAQFRHDAAVVLVVGGVVGIVTSLGLLALQRWARWLAIGCYGINILSSLSLSNPMGVMISLYCGGYLAFSRQVRDAFAVQTLAPQVVESSADTASVSPGSAT